MYLVMLHTSRAYISLGCAIWHRPVSLQHEVDRKLRFPAFQGGTKATGTRFGDGGGANLHPRHFGKGWIDRCELFDGGKGGVDDHLFVQGDMRD